MNAMLNKTIDILAYGLMTLSLMAVLTACPDDKSSEETGPASGGSESGPSPGSEPVAGPVRPEAMPLLCGIDGGKWCGGCPQADAGPLCCTGEACVVSDGKPCAGILGWCENYSTSAGIATCHDGSSN